MKCLDENTVARLVARTLEAPREAEVHAHLAGCAACREVVAGLLAVSAPSADLPTDDAPLLRRGARLGRYEVHELHGVGGMGVVYAATDTTLGRKVALKLLRSGAQRQERLLAEARALARLSHPSVVQVYDVALDGEQLYLAMEWVDGVTLHEWLKKPARSRREVLAAFVAAGRGLAAVHRAGLLHRDFKPQNVLVSADGRVRVTDLGLALEADARSADSSGTPAYMAPEQRRGEPGSPAQDQYSFCVALGNALDGQRLGPLEAVLARGLAYDPAARYPSMDALLDALENARLARVRRALTAAALVLVAAAVGAAGLRAAHDDCRSIPTQLDGVWDATRRERLRSVLPAELAERALKQLDARASEWQTAKLGSCTRPAADDVTHQLEQQCLDDRRQELRVVTDLLLQAKDTAFETKETEGLDLMLRAGACPQQAKVRRRLPQPPDSARAALLEVREGLAQARALARGGDYPRALEQSKAAVQQAKASAWAALELEALSELAAIEDQAGHTDDAVRDFSAAGYAAEAQGNDEIAASAWCALTLIVGYRQGKAEVARHFAALGRAVLERAGDAPAWDACLTQNTALLAIREGHHAQAARGMKSAVELATRAYGADDPHTLRALGIYGTALGELGRHDEALQARERALAGIEATKGTGNADAAVAQLRVAESLLALGRRTEALEHASLAVERQAALVGPRHFRYGIALCIRGSIESELGQHGAALLDLEHGRDAILAEQAPDSMFVAQPLVAYAEALERAGRHLDAVAQGAQAVKLLDQKLEEPNVQTAYALVVLGEAKLGAGDPKAAAIDLQRAVALYARAGEDADPAHARRAAEALERARPGQ